MNRGKVPETLMRPFLVIKIDVPAELMPGRMFIGITSDDVDLFLFDASEEPLGKGVVGASSDSGKAQVCPHEGKELLCYK